MAVRFNIAAPGNVLVGVYDLSGRLVVPCVDGVLGPGEYHMVLNLDRAVPGMYFVRLATPRGAESHKLTYVRQGNAKAVSPGVVGGCSISGVMPPATARFRLPRSISLCDRAAIDR